MLSLELSAPCSSHTLPQRVEHPMEADTWTSIQHWEAHQPLAEVLVTGQLWAAGARAAAPQGPDKKQGSTAAAATGRSHCSSWRGSDPVSTAWGAGLALCPQPEELGWPLMPCSSPDLQTHSAPHAVWVIQAHKGVIKIHSKLMSATSVLMSMAERHSRSGWRRTLISPLKFPNRVGSAGRDGDWGVVAGGSVWCHTAHTDRTHSLIPAHKHFTRVLCCLTASLPGWPFQRNVICQHPSR